MGSGTPQSPVDRHFSFQPDSIECISGEVHARSTVTVRGPGRVSMLTRPLQAPFALGVMAACGQSTILLQ